MLSENFGLTRFAKERSQEKRKADWNEFPAPEDPLSSRYPLFIWISRLIFLIMKTEHEIMVLLQALQHISLSF